MTVGRPFFIEFLQEGGGGSIPELRSGGLLRSPESRSDSMEPPHLPAGTFQKEKYSLKNQQEYYNIVIRKYPFL